MPRTWRVHLNFDSESSYCHFDSHQEGVQINYNSKHGLFGLFLPWLWSWGGRKDDHVLDPGRQANKFRCKCAKNVLPSECRGLCDSDYLDLTIRLSQTSALHGRCLCQRPPSLHFILTPLNSTHRLNYEKIYIVPHEFQVRLEIYISALSSEPVFHATANCKMPGQVPYNMKMR